MRTLIRGGRVIDPASGRDEVADVAIANGRIQAIGDAPGDFGADRVIDADGLVVCPGLVDMHVHLREPGQEWKEDIESGSRAAAAGGVTSVACMANTRPVNDRRSVTEQIKSTAQRVGLSRVHPIGAITRDLAGETLTEMHELAGAGCVAFSDDGRPVPDAGIMRRALEYAATFDYLLILHEEEGALSAGGAMNEGAHATRMGLPGIPNASEDVMIARDVILAELTGGRIHIAHVATSGGVELIRQAQARGLPVTGEAAPHHLFLTDTDVGAFDSHAKMAPPLRSPEDRAAVRAAVADGTLTAIATDHAPHEADAKSEAFACCANGVTGLETLLGLTLRLVDEEVLDLPSALARVTNGPAEVLGLEAGRLGVGEVADVCLFDPETEWTVEPERMYSRSVNTPFAGWRLRGRVTHTLVGGRLAYPFGDAE
ncbi:dihydroorotase [Thiohalorhabdus denitrificans]|uniref:Dihydroorotase n=1 Tax=Thiohalorhabdus denitrificans TaxID=381306 RepID=A0A0P9C8M2_9GAMM|nr:dihydroorotase [Thiohalorhabdus denitrificans]KPV39534.1 dihydroorotase [Thiohalorhabdus denitrificans]SCX99493.1 dihydroorotase [Thiohalorhabdus denitrificans]